MVQEVGPQYAHKTESFTHIVAEMFIIAVVHPPGVSIHSLVARVVFWPHLTLMFLQVQTWRCWGAGHCGRWDWTTVMAPVMVWAITLEFMNVSSFLFMCMSTPVALFVCIYCYTGSLLEALRRNIFFYTYSTYTLPNLYSDVTPDVTPYFPTGPVGFQTNNIPFKEGMFTSIGKNSPVKSVTLPSQVVHHPPPLVYYSKAWQRFWDAGRSTVSKFTLTLICVWVELRSGLAVRSLCQF